MLEAQAQHSLTGVWFFESQNILKEFGMGLENSEIKLMKRNYFRNLTKMKAKKVAFTELTRKKNQGKRVVISNMATNSNWQITCKQTKCCHLKINAIYSESKQK